jgi:hypothetical protein
MKALGMTAVVTFLLVGCGSGPGGTGGGGQGTGAGGSASTTSSTETLGAGGSTPCSTGADCATCTTLETCVACYGAKHPSAAAAFNALESCVLCNTCAVQCGDAAGSSYCAGAPAEPGSCGLGPNDPADCQDCITCAGMSQCADELAACEANPECKPLLEETCPLM